MKKTILILALGSYLIFGCTNASYEDLHVHDEEENNGQPLTYVDDIKSIIDNNCTSCHGNPPTQGAPTSFTTYTEVKNNINKILTRINSTGSAVMPPTGPISQQLRDDIQQWKDDGLLEN